MTVYWAKDKADYFIYGCPDLHIVVDHKPLLAFFRENPKPLDQIVNKRLRMYVSEINTLKFKNFHIAGAKNYLSDQGSRFPSGVAGADKGEKGSENIVKSDNTVSSSQKDKSTAMSDNMGLGSQKDNALDECTMAQVFAYGARCPAFDADCKTDNIGDSDDFIAQSMCEVASILSISAGKHISIVITVDRLQVEIQSDEHYKYLRQKVAR